jgi:hypothetical protein
MWPGLAGLTSLACSVVGQCKHSHPIRLWPFAASTSNFLAKSCNFKHSLDLLSPWRTAECQRKRPSVRAGDRAQAKPLSINQPFSSKFDKTEAPRPRWATEPLVRRKVSLKPTRLSSTGSPQAPDDVPSTRNLSKGHLPSRTPNAKTTNNHLVDSTPHQVDPSTKHPDYPRSPQWRNQAPIRRLKQQLVQGEATIVNMGQSVDPDEDFRDRQQ